MSRTPLLSTVLGVALLCSTAFCDDVLVVAPPAFEPALATWRAHREKGGWTVLVRAPGDDVAATVAAVGKERGEKLRAVLLLGDVAQVPCVYRPADAIKEWERDPRIATDAPYADLDGDGSPDLTLGRLPARTVDEARMLLDRGVEYERSRDFGEWRRTLHLVGGVGGFGAQQDAALEQLTALVMNRGVPESAEVTFSYAQPSSAYCPPPSKFSDDFIGRINGGALIVAYVGHGSRTHLDRVRSADGAKPILESDQVDRIDVTGGAPLVVFVACSTGSFDGTPECLAESVLRRPHGPVAVIASSRVSTPYSNAVLARELLTPLYGDGALTAGDLLLRAKQGLLADGKGDPLRSYMESMAANFYEKDAAVRAKDRAEHVLLYQLFGDPCLVLARPVNFALEPEEEATAGGKLSVSGTAPFAGKLTLEIVRRRDDRPAVPVGDRTAEEMAATFAAANHRVVASSTSDVKAGAFSAVVTIGTDVPEGRYLVRAFIEGGGGSAMAGSETRIFAKR